MNPKISLRAQIRRCVAIAPLLFAMLSCGTHTRIDDRSVEEVDLTSSGSFSPALDRPNVESSTGSAAVDQLLQRAQAAIDAGEHGRAEALVERAVRLSPNDGRVYFGLAQVHYYQQEFALSRSFLNKARRLAVNDRKLLRLIDDFAARTR